MADISRPVVCVSYIGKSLTPAEHYEGTVSDTVESTTDIAHLTPSSHVAFIGCDTKITESSMALPCVNVSYLGTESSKAVQSAVAIPVVCVSYIGNSTPAAETYTETVSGTVESTTDIAHLTPSSNVAFIGCDTKIIESSMALPVVCVSYVPSSNNDIDLDFDTARNISNVVTVNHNTCRNVSTAQTFSADLLRDVTASAVLNLDSSRIVASHVTVDFDTERKINGAISTTADFDLSRNVTATQNFSIDIKRNVITSIALNADTSREVLNAHIPQTLNVDTCRNVSQPIILSVDTVRDTAKKNYLVWLKFDDSPTDDAAGNSWITYGNPTVSTTHAVSGKALQLDGQSYIDLNGSIPLGGQDFCIEGTGYFTSGTALFIKKVTDSERVNVQLLSLETYNSHVFLSVNRTVWNDSNFYAGIESNVGINQQVNFKLLYHYEDNTLYFYLNDNLVGSHHFSQQLPTFDYNVSVGVKNGNSFFTGSIDELRIYNFDNISKIFFDTCRNVCQSVALFCDTARITQGGSVTLLCDTQRIITADGFWRYENYGTADLLSTSGTTVTNLTTNQAVYQTAFYQPNRAKCFDIPATKEIWIKCDIFTTANYKTNDRIRIYSDDGNDVNGWCTFPNITEAYALWHNGTSVQAQSYLSSNKNRPFLLHMKSDATNGVVEFFFASGLDTRYTGNVNNGNDFDNVYIQMDGSNIYVSDLIISNVAVDINEHTKYPLAFNVDSLRNVIETFAQQFYVDTLRNVVRSNLLNLDTLRELILSAGVDFDTLRNVISTVEQNLDAVRTLAHNLILSPVYNFGDLPDTSDDRRAGLQSFEIQIGEQQLTDSVNFVSVNPVDILEQVKGQYLDYKFNMRVEKIVRRGILRTCNCCCDIDELLFKQLDYVIPEEKRWTEYARPPIGLIEPREEDKILRYAPASEHIIAIANAIGKTPVLQFADFVSNVDITSGGTTYNDLIKAIFGWSSRVPQMMINCYLRDDKLFVVQRGYESNIVDLSNYQSDVVSVSKDIVRTYWGSHLWNETEVTERPAGYTTELITKTVPTEKVDDNGNKTTYKPSNSGKVLVTQTEETVNGQTIVKTFDYDSDDFLILSTEQGNDYKIQTSYEYKTFGRNQKVLVRETTTVSEQNSSGVWEVTDQRSTSHDYLHEGGGQVYVSANVTDLADVDHTGNVVGNKNGNDRISPYQIYTWENGERRAIEAAIMTPIYDRVHRTINGVTLFDSSFPIHGDEKLIEITDAIKWLNRKTQEVINLNVYDFPHVIDFNDRIVFGGNTYFLKSNTALKNDDIVNKQTISAVRWY